MEIVNHNTDPQLRPPNLFEKGFKAKTSTRMHYEAQVHVIQRQIGDLETLRVSMGLSARKMCQLLLVDPSAWTRWKSEGAPPHIWRALQWYFIIQEKIPGLTPQYFTGKDPEILHAEVLKKISQTGQSLSQEFSQELAIRNSELSQKISGLEGRVKQHRLMIWGLLAICIGLASALLVRQQ